MNAINYMSNGKGMFVSVCCFGRCQNKGAKNSPSALKTLQIWGLCFGRGLSDRAFVHAELGSSGARVFFLPPPFPQWGFAPQGALRIQPGHGPRQQHLRVHGGPLQRHEARGLVLRRKARGRDGEIGDLNTRHRAYIRAQEISKFPQNFGEIPPLSQRNNERNLALLRTRTRTNTIPYGTKASAAG